MSTKKALPSSTNKNKSTINSNISGTPRLGKNSFNSSRMLGVSATKSSNLSQLNASVCGLKSNLRTYIPQDADIETDMVYSEYLQAMAMKIIFTKVLAEDKIAWDLDLCNKNEVLISKEKEPAEMEHKQQIKEMQITLYKLFLNLKIMIDKLLCYLVCNNIPEKLDNFIKVLHEACNKLEIENIKPLNTSADYTKLNESILMYSTILKSLQPNNKDSIALNDLAEQISRCIDLGNDVHQDMEYLNSLTKHYLQAWYKTLSDAFADGNKNRKLYSF